MRKALGLGFAVVALTLGMQSEVEATPALTLNICQGGTCVVVGPTSGSIVVFPAIVVGDYLVSVTGATIESATSSNSQTTTISVQRLTGTSADPLNVWLQATGYSAPTGPAYNFTTTHSATQTGGFTPLIQYQGYYSATNGSGYPPAGSFTNGVIGCTPTAGAAGSCATNGATILVPGSTPFSIVTRATFNIAQSATSSTATYGISSQAILTAVPEPGSMLLLGTGLFGIGALARRRFQTRRSAR